MARWGSMVVNLGEGGKSYQLLRLQEKGRSSAGAEEGSEAKGWSYGKFPEKTKDCALISCLDSRRGRVGGEDGTNRLWRRRLSGS